MEDGLHRSRKRNELLFGVEIDEDKDGGPRTDAAVDFDAVRDRTEDGGDAANVDHPLRKRGHEIGIEDGADIGDASLAEGMSDDAGLAVEPPVDRKSTRLNSSHGYISYAVFCLKKKRRRSRVGDDVAHNSCCVLHFSC